MLYHSRLGSRREYPLQRDAEVEREVGLHVVMWEATARRRQTLEGHLDQVLRTILLVCIGIPGYRVGGWCRCVAHGVVGPQRMSVEGYLGRQQGHS